MSTDQPDAARPEPPRDDAPAAPTKHTAPTAQAASTEHAAPGAPEALAAAYAARRAEVHALSRALHADPEIAFAEHRSAERCAALLEQAGFTLERGVGELPTAFTATLGTGSLVAVLCVEYDALPGIGHGCGHNLIAGASVGAALALADPALLEDLDLTLRVIGSPAEEHGGGKQLLIERGVFDGAHLALMSHPTPATDTYDVLGSTSQAVGRWRATFTGRGAHAAANPADGINANDAAVLAQVAAGLLRQRMLDGQRVALVPQADGVTNIVPEQAVVDFECRALTREQFAVLRDRLLACFEGAALATGTTVEIVETEPVYQPLRQDPDLGAAWNRAMQRRGRPLDGSLGVSAASTDMGNVSQRLPGLHPFVGITGAGGALHTREFAEHAASGEGYRLMDDCAVAMAQIIAEIAADGEVRRRVIDRARAMAGARAMTEESRERE